MSVLQIRDLPLRGSLSNAYLPLSRTRPEEIADVTLLNLNLMLVNADGTFDQQAYVPLGLLYVASTLEQQGYNVEFGDFQTFSAARSFDADLLIQSLGEPAPIIGISVMSNLLPFSIHVARKLKERWPDRRVVLGGVGPSPVAAEIISTFPFIDHVVEGEGERNMLELVQGKTRDRVLRPKIALDLDELPPPSYSLLDFSLYDAQPSVVTSRGCPYKCAFCTEPYNFGGTVRFRDVDAVLSEIEEVHARSGRTMFLFQDDFVLAQSFAFDRLRQDFPCFAQGIKQRPQDFDRDEAY